MRNLATVLVTDKESGQSAEVQLDELTNLTNSVVMLSVGPDEIASIEAQSGDLLITLNSGEAIIIAGFFDTPEGERNELVLEDANGILWWGQYDSPWSEFSFAEINLLDEAAKDQEIGWWLIAAGLGGAAAIAAAAGGGSSGGSSPSTPEDSEPDPAPAPVVPDAPIVNSVTNNFDDQGTPTGTTVSGEADPGNSVEIRDGDGNVVGSGEADDDGNFEIITDEPLADGEEYDVVAIDEDGNVSDPTPITGDLTPPNVTVEDLVTNEVAPELSGTIDDPDATVQVTIGDATHEATNNGDGTWSLTWPEALGEDDYTVEVEATDPAGNTGTAQGDLTIDTTAPEVTVEDLVTNEVAPELSGTIDDPDATVQVTIGDATHEATNNGDGTWSLTWPEALGEDDYTVEVEATDPAGNTGTAQGDLTIDTTAPEVTVEDLVTNEVAPELSGTIDDPDATVQVTIGDATHEATNNGDGTWSLTWPEALGEDDYTVEVEATDPAGNTGTAQGDLTIDTTAPDTPVITGAVDDVEPAGDLADGDVTNDSTPTLEGTAEADSTVTLFQDGVEIGTTTADVDGNWSFEVPALEDDTFTFTATATDAAGNVSAESGAFELSVDTTAPDSEANSIAFVDPNEDGWINAAEVESVELEGQLDADDDVTITSIVITDDVGGSVVVDAADITVTDGVISVAGQDLSGLADGELTVTMTVTDVAGNAIEVTDTIALDATAPDAPTLELANDTGDVDGVTSDGTVNVGGLEENATWEYSTDGGGTWLPGSGDSFVLLDGDYDEGDVLARQTDEAGNISDDGILEMDVTVDGSTPTITIDTIAGDDVLNLAESQEELTITGTTTGVEDGQVVTVTLDGETYTGAVTGNAWSVTVPSEDLQALGDGQTYTVTADVDNVAGNSAEQATREIGTDFTSPGGEDGTDAPVLAIAEADNGFINAEELADGIQAVVTLTEGTQEGDTVTVTLSDADGTEHVFTHTVTADDIVAGEAALTLEGDFAEGAASAVAVITDEAGNRSADSNEVTFEIDTLAPDAPTLELANDTGDVDGVTSDGTVNVGGLEENATWEYSTDGGASWTEGTGDSFVLPEGDYAEGDVLARQTDEAGNTSDNGELGAVTVDTTAPDAPTAAFNDVGDAISGEAEPGSTVIVRDEDGNELGRTTADEDGSYTIELDEPLTDGEEVTVTATDEAGNESAPTEATAPQAPPVLSLALANDTGIDGDGITSDGTVEVEGLVAGATWEYSIDGGENWIDGDGNSFELPAGEYADGAVIARQTVGELTSPPGSLGAVTIVELNAADDAAALDMGEQSVTVSPSETEENVQVLGVAEGEGGELSGTTFTVAEGQTGEVALQIQQTALVAVADAFRVEVYDEGGNLVYVGGTEDSLVGDVGGLEILGLTGYDTLTAVLTDLAPGEYSVVVRNEESELAGLLGEGLTLEELGEAGVVLGPDNQEAVLDAVEDALNADLLIPGLDLGLGTFVRNILEPLLDGTTELGAGELVGILTGPLDGLGITGVLDTVVDAIAEELLSNTLTAFQFTDITTTVTEYGFTTNDPISGNVITGDAGVGEDELVPGSEVSLVQLLDAEDNPAGDPVMVPESGSVEIAGLYGVLTIAADGGYSYAANGDRASLGESETFTYTVSDGLNETTANLTIKIDGEVPPGLAAQPDSVEPDSVDLDMGSQSAVVNEPQANSNVQVLGLLEGDSGEISGVPFTVSEDQLGEMTIQVSQTALVAVADAFVIEVVDAAGNVVFTAATPDNPLVGDVAGINLLGLTGDNTLTATATGLPPGDYTVVVRNDQGALADLLTGLSVQELGEAGVILGPENQELVLDAVDTALGGNLLSGTVRSILELTLNTLNGLGVDRLVDVLTDTLTVLGLGDLVDGVLNAVAGALVSNTLTLLQSTEMTTTLTEYAFDGDLEFSGNVITGEGDGNVADGIAQGSVVTRVENANGEVVEVLGSGSEGVTIAGLYGVLTIFEDGSYTYDATGARAGLGQEEVFTYTVTDGSFNPDGSRVTGQATLTINIDGQGTAGDIAFAGVEYDFATADGVDWDNEIGFSWLLGALGITVWTRQDPTSRTIEVEENTTQDLTISVTGGDLLSVGGNTSIALEKRVDGSWEVERSFNNDQLIGLLGLGSGGEFVVSGLTAGEYRVTMEVGTGLLGLPGSIRADISSTVTLLDEFEVDNVATAEGNLLENDVLRGEEFELSVSTDGVTFESIADGAVTLIGEHGSLTVQDDGSYVYAPNDLAHFTETLSETFTYQVAYPDGRVEEAELTVFVEPSGAGVESLGGASIEGGEGAEAFALMLDDGDLDMLDDSEEGDVLALGSDELEDGLTLGSEEVIELTGDDNILQITGDSEDTLNVSGAEATGETQVINGVTYTEYTFGDDATLLVQDGVNVEGA